MKASLQLRLSQHLALTPQLQQSIKLLQLSTVELNQELERFIAENPLLERADLSQDTELPVLSGLNVNATQNNLDRDNQQHGDANGVNGADSAASANEGQDNSNDDFREGGDAGEAPRFNEMTSSVRRDSDSDDDEFGMANQLAAADPTLQEHLLQQLTLTSLTTCDRQIASLLIAHLDDDGYLTHDLADLQEQLAPYIDVDEDDLQIAVKHVQNLEPAGVCARTLAECLQLQLRAMPSTTPYLTEAMTLAGEHLDLLAQRDFAKLKRVLRLSDDQLKATRALIVSLDPKPGRQYSVGEIRYIVHDIVVKKVQGRWQAMLNNEAMPRLRVNKLYANLVQKSRDSDGKNLAGQLQEARWLIKNIQQRFETILKVAEAIVDNQRHFFEHGEIAMRPLVLREIADQVGLHESTVSRVTTQKYMLTPKGIFELKYFFGSSVATEDGGACSATAIRALIKQLVEAEDQRKPLSDNKIADLLSNQGILVARRTVAKYRESMQIEPASLRKSL